MNFNQLTILIKFVKMNRKSDIKKRTITLAKYYVKKNNIEKAIKYYSKIINETDNKMMIELGILCKNNNKLFEAYKLFSKASELNDIAAKLNLAEMFMNGDYIKKNYNEAIRLYLEIGLLGEKIGYEKIIEQVYEKNIKLDHLYENEIYENILKLNDNNLFYKLGIMYYTEENKNIDRAKILFKKGYDDVKCINSLGIIYFNEKKYAKAKKTFMLGILFDNDDSYNNMAFTIQHDKENFDEESMINYYMKAVKNKHVDAIKNLSYYYYNNKKYDDAIKILKYDENNIINIRLLVKIYEKQGNKEILSLLNKGKDLGDFYCMNKLALFYKNGIFVKKDLNYSKKIFLYTAKNGYTKSWASLGDIYVNYDIKKAIKYYKTGIDNNDPKCMVNLAIIYLNNNITESIELLNKAIKLNYPRAFLQLAYLYQKGILIKKDISMAKNLYEQAIKLNNTDALCELAMLVIEENSLKGIKMLFEAKEKNSSLALYYIAHLYFLNGQNQKAYYILKKAAKEKNIYAYIHLAIYNLRGIYVKKNIKKGKENIKKVFNIINNKKIIESMIDNVITMIQSYNILFNKN